MSAFAVASAAFARATPKKPNIASVTRAVLKAASRSRPGWYQPGMSIGTTATATTLTITNGKAFSPRNPMSTTRMNTIMANESSWASGTRRAKVAIITTNATVVFDDEPSSADGRAMRYAAQKATRPTAPTTVQRPSV